MNIMKKAHKMTRELKKEFPSIDYKAQLGICISYLNKEVKVKELVGSEKQIKFAQDILNKINEFKATLAVNSGMELELRKTFEVVEGMTKASDIIEIFKGVVYGNVQRELYIVNENQSYTKFNTILEENLTGKITIVKLDEKYTALLFETENKNFYSKRITERFEGYFNRLLKQINDKNINAIIEYK